MAPDSTVKDRLDRYARERASRELLYDMAWSGRQVRAPFKYELRKEEPIRILGAVVPFKAKR